VPPSSREKRLYEASRTDWAIRRFCSPDFNSIYASTAFLNAVAARLRRAMQDDLTEVSEVASIA
jgi:hypothetical protein